MHMADALISVPVGGVMWAATGGLVGYCSNQVKKAMDDVKVPLMGVTAAFVFAAQMINFTIPGTGSSGHLGGGLLMAVLLGPHAAFLAMASVLTVQALFFADGGLLALGCNIFNLGFFPCLVAYPLIFKKIVGRKPTHQRLVAASLVAAIVGLQLGAFGVVVETWASGVSELPFVTFVSVMQPIHLAIGVVEGLATAAVVAFAWTARPELLESDAGEARGAGRSVRWVIAALLVLAVATGGVLSWFASTRPDGLEWAMARTSGTEELEAPETGLHGVVSRMQEQVAVLPDYSFKTASSPESEETPSWPAPNTGTSISGLVGSFLTLLVAVGIGVALGRRRPTSRAS